MLSNCILVSKAATRLPASEFLGRDFNKLINAGVAAKPRVGDPMMIRSAWLS
jgi:hypothetical protein